MDGLVGLDYPEAPEVPDCPDIPDVPGYPGYPGLPVLPEFLDCSGSSGVSGLVYAFVLSENLIVSPPPGVVSARHVPPYTVTAFFTMASPRPVPPSLRERPLSTR